MKYWQILMISLLLAVSLFMAGCSNQSTQINPEKEMNSTLKNLGTEQNQVNVTSPSVTQPVQPTVSIITTVSIPKVSVKSIDVNGSRFGASRFVFNQIYVSINSDTPLDWRKLSIYVGNRYYNGSSNYSENVSCASIISLLTNRNKSFAVSGSSTSATICLSPPRDMATPDSVNFVGTYQGNVLINETLAIPTGVLTTTYHIK